MNQRDTIKAIRAEWTEETGEDPGAVGASVILDNLCDAFVHKVEGAGVEYAVRADRFTAEYLSHRWNGEDGRRLRAELVRTR